jgi:hypothetical protein
MKILLAITIITCLFVVGQAQNVTQCATRLAGLSSCISQVGAGGGGNFCSDCSNQLISYYRDCTNGVGVDAVQQRKLRSACSRQLNYRGNI